ncbi:prolipoprotein diacylglyceryl transferase [Clostridium polynesiense]|uniref:prolipoprotein diacylglyceryl transferase n=1 Tax=Clostridium polynesiense TaxID=1325933 RepID=UPI00058C6F3B|nr:prolipoprotein diacylglyceryl transferase [Clostridium polynesiense]
MRPVLFRIFGIEVYGYGLMIALGIISGILLLNYRAKKRGYNEDNILNMALLAVAGGILGGKLLYIITDYKAVLQNPSMIIKNFGEGFVIYGAIMGGGIAVYLYCRTKHWNIYKILDLAVPSVAIGQGFGRIGCFFAGCCYGAPTNSPLSCEFPAGGFAPAGIHLHPTQIYSSVFNFLLAFFLLWYDNKKERKGRTFSLYLIIYSIGRFLIEIIRNDPRGSVGVFSTSQFIAIFTLLLGIIVFYITRNKGSELSVEEK